MQRSDLFVSSINQLFLGIYLTDWHGAPGVFKSIWGKYWSGFWVWIACVLGLISFNANAAMFDWTLFKQRFMQPEGRIIDSGHSKNISHSEGQGMAMLLSVHYNDRVVFDTIWQWTRQNLQVRDDKLLAWQWSSDAGVSDKNNASDGDLFVAWALLRARDKWQDPAYLSAAMEIIQDIRQKLLRKTSRGVVLLPGMEGFEKDVGTIVNLSYWIFPAIQEISQIDVAPEWMELQQTGINLLLEAHFGRWGLPPDWILLSEKLASAPDFPSRFGYDAVRIPLYLIWGKLDTEQLLSPFQNFWEHFTGAKFLPAWTNLNDDSIDSYDASPGIRGIGRLTLDHSNFQKVELPPLDSTQDYYSSVLLLLNKLAVLERLR